MYYVYVLECSNGSLYTGLTNDLPHVTLATLPKAERTEEEGVSSLEKTAP